MRALYPASSRRRLKRWLEDGRVRVNGAVVRRGDAAVGAHDRVQLAAAPGPEFPAALRLVHEDADLLVVDKPPGLLTIATARERERTAYRMLAAYVAGGPSRRAAPGTPRLFIVHRLDRETSGLLAFAKASRAKRLLQAQFAARTVERVYVAVVEGRVREAAGTLRGRLVEDHALRVRPAAGAGTGRQAITHYRVLESRPLFTRLELRLTTGRRGQIRAQLAALGHPIAGDRDYGSRRDPLRRLCLHATRLAFVHPRGGWVRFESAVPAGFLRL